MRRAIVTLCLVLASLAAFPSRADAFFWSWLDDLSGPQFRGIAVDWQVWCRNKPASPDPKGHTRTLLMEDKTDLYSHAADLSGRGSGNAATALFETAEAHADEAIRLLDLSETALADDNSALALQYFGDALTRWSEAAEAFRAGYAHAESASLRRDQELSRRLEARRATKQAQQSEKRKSRFANAGVVVSLCDARPTRDTTRFVSLHYGFGWDIKNATDQNRMVTAGLSVHSVIKPYLTIGAGAGVASFSGDNADAFSKVYLQPAIIDVRIVAALFRNEDKQWAPWRQLVIVRFDGTVFPTGFEAGRFGGTSKRFKTEFVPSVGVNFDLTPYVRKWQGMKPKPNPNP